LLGGGVARIGLRQQLVECTGLLTYDKVMQVKVGDQAHPNLISISESLSPIEKQDLIPSYGSILIFLLGVMKTCLALILR